MKTPQNDVTSSLYEAVIDNPKVPMTLRVGIAGPRHLKKHETEQGLAELTRVLDAIGEQLVSFVQHQDIVKKLYDVQGHKQPTIRLTSSLAIGADRLAMERSATANSVNQVDVEHAAILPFLYEQCEHGFYDDTQTATKNEYDWKEFGACIERIKQQEKCRIIELDGDISSPNTRDQAHFRCTQYLVENIDLLIVINKEDGNGERSDTAMQHKAGTHATITLAKDAGRPIIEITVAEKEQTRAVTIHPAKVFGCNENVVDYSKSALERLLCNVVLFESVFMLDEAFSDGNSNIVEKKENYAKAQQNKKESITKGLQHHVDDKIWLTKNNGPTNFDYQGKIDAWFSRTDKLIGRQGFDSFKRFLTSDKEVEFFKNRLKRSDLVNQADNQASEPPHNSAEAHNWFAYFLRADSLAKRFALVHRSTYLLIYFFAASALIIAATALAYQSNSTLVVTLIICEFLVLILIYALYMIDHHNHNKWLQNRCLAEAIRPNIYLSQLGRCFSFFNVRSSDEFMYREIMGHNQSGAQWVCIQQELINRHIGFNHCRYTPEYLKESITFLNTAWVSGQISYHLTNSAKMQAIGKRFSKNTHWLFFLTVFALIMKAILKFGVFGDIGDSPGLTAAYQLSALLTAVFPILGTALFAIRNHSEFDISAQRSLTMLAFFNSIYGSLRSKTGEPSMAFDADLKRLTDVSAQEMSDWLEIYEVKESEPG